MVPGKETKSYLTMKRKLLKVNIRKENENMREIKFRGLSKGLNEWTYGYYNACAGSWGEINHFISYPFSNGILVDENTIGQYTGVKDKNGKEIYEGDILKVKLEYKHWNLKNMDLEDEIDTFTYSVRFGKYDQDGSGDEYIPVACVGFYADLIEKNYEQECEYTTSILELNNFEIIGNIYENPELLEEVK